jgi:hypothetical protein
LWRIIWLVFVYCALPGIGSSAAPTFTTLVSFGPPPAPTPASGPLVQGPNGNLYGATVPVGFGGSTAVFEMTAGGELTTLNANLNVPNAGLVLGPDGNFYGTTQGGCCGESMVFEMTPGGDLTELYVFSLPSFGELPLAGLVLATNGNLYGTTVGDGQHTFG